MMELQAGKYPYMVSDGPEALGTSLRRLYDVAYANQLPYQDIWRRGFNHFMLQLDAKRHPHNLDIYYPLIKPSVVSIVARMNQRRPKLLVEPLNRNIPAESRDRIEALLYYNWWMARSARALRDVGILQEMTGTAFLKAQFERVVRVENRWVVDGDRQDPLSWPMMIRNDMTTPDYQRSLQPWPVVDFDGVKWQPIAPSRILVSPGATSIHPRDGGKPARYVVEIDAIDWDVANHVPWYNKKSLERYKGSGEYWGNTDIWKQCLNSMGLGNIDQRVRRIVVVRFYFPENGEQIDWIPGDNEALYRGPMLHGDVPFVKFTSSEVPGEFYGTPRWRDGERLQEAVNWEINWMTEYLAYRSQPAMMHRKGAIDPKDWQLRPGARIPVNVTSGEPLSNVVAPFQVANIDPLNLHMTNQKIGYFEEALGISSIAKGMPAGAGSPTEAMQAMASGDLLSQYYMRAWEESIGRSFELTLNQFRIHSKYNRIVPVVGKYGEMGADEQIVTPEDMAYEWMIQIEPGSMQTDDANWRERASMVEFIKLTTETGMASLLNPQEVIKVVAKTYAIDDLTMSRMMKTADQIQAEMQAQVQAMAMAQMTGEGGEQPQGATNLNDAVAGMPELMGGV